MRECIFCNVELSGANRAKEHVLRNSWLKELGAEKSELRQARLRGPVVLDQREFAADSLQAGEVCHDCNNGWMNTLDLGVEGLIMPLAKKSGQQITWNLEEGRRIAAWLLKTACTYSATDSRDRRHIPQKLIDAAREGYLPPGFIAFAAVAPSPRKHVSVVQLDVWNEDGYQSLGLPQSTRLKFAVQYDNLFLGCVWSDVPNPLFSFLWHVHTVIAVEKARFGFRQMLATDAEPYADVPPYLTPNDIHLFLAPIGAHW